jgi:hypothetical protein
MAKPKVLKIVQCEEYKHCYSIGDDLEYYLDDMLLDNIHSIELSSHIGKATIAVVKMLVTPEIKINESYIVLKRYRFRRIKELIKSIKLKLRRIKRKILRKKWNLKADRQQRHSPNFATMDENGNIIPSKEIDSNIDKDDIK